MQTVAITAATLTAYFVGLKFFPEAAATMAFVTLSFSELLRAFTSRSEYISVFKIGFFSNRTMNLAVISSLVLLLGVIYVPFLRPIFDTVALDMQQWEIILPLLLVPSIAAEVTKAIASRKK